MKRSLVLAAAAAATLLTATAAHAGGVNWSVGISLPPVATVVSNGPAYYPAPYYGAPAYYPEPVYYSAPAYSYYPAPVYYAPRVYAPGRGSGSPRVPTTTADIGAATAGATTRPPPASAPTGGAEPAPRRVGPTAQAALSRRARENCPTRRARRLLQDRYSFAAALVPGPAIGGPSGPPGVPTMTLHRPLLSAVAVGTVALFTACSSTP